MICSAIFAVERRLSVCLSVCPSVRLSVCHDPLLYQNGLTYRRKSLTVWNSLPDLVTSAPSVAVFRSRLKTHLFNISYPCACTVPAQWPYSCFGHYNRSCLLTYLLWPPDSPNDLVFSTNRCYEIPTGSSLTGFLNTGVVWAVTERFACFVWSVTWTTVC